MENIDNHIYPLVNIGSNLFIQSHVAFMSLLTM